MLNNIAEGNIAGSMSASAAARASQKGVASERWDWLNTATANRSSVNMPQNSSSMQSPGGGNFRRKRRPLILQSCGDFLIAAAENPSVDILTGLRTLLKVYDIVHDECDSNRYMDRLIECADFTALADFATQYKESGSLSFNMIRLDLTSSSSDRTKVMITPRPWVPVRDPEVLNSLQVAGHSFATRILQAEISEAVFLESVNHIYPELGYFANGGGEIQRVLTSMLSVFLLMVDDHRGFTRGQSSDAILSQYNWNQLQDWVDSHLGYADDASFLDALFVLIAIQDVCLIRPLRLDLAPHTIDPSVGLSYILAYHHFVLPSFTRLPDNFRKMIRACVNVGFSFSSFLESEDLPANLNCLRALIEDEGERTCSFYGFYWMARFCAGPNGSNRGFVNQGPLFLNDYEYKNYKRGVDAIRYLVENLSDSHARNSELVQQSYDSYLQKRGALVFTTFVSRIERAIVRLACLCRAFDFNSGKRVKLTFEKMFTDERNALANYLT